MNIALYEIACSNHGPVDWKSYDYCKLEEVIYAVYKADSLADIGIQAEPIAPEVYKTGIPITTNMIIEACKTLVDCLATFIGDLGVSDGTAVKASRRNLISSWRLLAGLVEGAPIELRNEISDKVAYLVNQIATPVDRREKTQLPAPAGRYLSDADVRARSVGLHPTASDSGLTVKTLCHSFCGQSTKIRLSQNAKQQFFIAIVAGDLVWALLSGESPEKTKSRLNIYKEFYPQVGLLHEG